METQSRYDPSVSAEVSGTLLDFDGTAITGGLTAFTLSLTDAHSGLTVNGRNAQNVLTANNVTFNSGTAAFVWSVQPGDLTPLDSGRSWAEHIANFSFTYGSGRVGKWRHRLRIVNYLTLCTFEDVKMLLDHIPDDDAPLIECLIESFSTRAERDTTRKFRKSTVASPTTEVVSIHGEKWHVRLSRSPIDSIVEVVETIDGDFGSAEAKVVPAADYAFVPEMGLLKLRWRPFLQGEQNYRIRYAGGLALDVGAVPFDLRLAAARQVAWWYQRRTQMGVSEIQVGRFGREELLSPLDLLLDVRQVLDFYRPIYV